jgi:hypothetical protein
VHIDGQVEGEGLFAQRIPLAKGWLCRATKAIRSRSSPGKENCGLRLPAYRCGPPAAVEGDVTISGNIDGQWRKVTLSLSNETYSQAVQAHDQRQTVRCTGDLVKAGRGYRLQNPRHF